MAASNPSTNRPDMLSTQISFTHFNEILSFYALKIFWYDNLFYQEVASISAWVFQGSLKH